MGYLKLKFVLQRYFPTPNINYSNLNYFTRDAAGALRTPMSAVFGGGCKKAAGTRVSPVRKV